MSPTPGKKSRVSTSASGRMAKFTWLEAEQRSLRRRRRRLGGGQSTMKMCRFPPCSPSTTSTSTRATPTSKSTTPSARPGARSGPVSPCVPPMSTASMMGGSSRSSLPASNAAVRRRLPAGSPQLALLCRRAWHLVPVRLTRWRGHLRRGPYARFVPVGGCIGRAHDLCRHHRRNRVRVADIHVQSTSAWRCSVTSIDLAQGAERLQRTEPCVRVRSRSAPARQLVQRPGFADPVRILHMLPIRSLGP